MEISGVPADRLYRRIDFLYHQCRDFSARKDRNLRKGFAGRNRVVAFDVQTILANWRHAHRVLNVPVHHAVTVDKQTGYVIAATTDFDPGTDAVDIKSMISIFQGPGDFTEEFGLMVNIEIQFCAV